MHRLLIVFLATGISGFSASFGVEVTCNGMNYFGYDSVSCGSFLTAFADAETSPSGGVSVDVGAAPGYSSSASASFTEDYVLTMTGGSGAAFAEPSMGAYGGAFDNDFRAAGYATVSNSSGYGCYVEGFKITTTNCNDRSLPFVFNTPQTITVSEEAGGSAIGADGVFGYEFSGAWGPEIGGFAFFNAQGQRLDGVSYTLVPGVVPEPGTLPLAGGGIACAALIALRRRRRTHSPA